MFGEAADAHPLVFHFVLGEKIDMHRPANEYSKGCWGCRRKSLEAIDVGLIKTTDFSSIRH